MPALYETLRPKSWAEVVGQPQAMAVLNNCRQRGGLNGQAYWLSGPSGTGKTTIARLIASEVTDGWGITEMDDPSEVTAEFVREATQDKRSRPFGRGYCYIVNESHGLRDDQVRKLLGLIETLPAWQTWIFTTTDKGQQNLMFDCDDAGPLLSRCVKLKLVPSEFEFAKNLVKQFRTLGVELTQSEACAIVKRNKGNHRSSIMDVATTKSVPALIEAA